MAKAKRVKGTDCHGAAVTGIKLVLITRFGELYDLRDAALDWTDPEGVHSMRVASRRLRSALRDFLPYVRKRNLTAVQRQMKNIADALGDVRDQDVAMMALDKIRPPADVVPGLKDSSTPEKQFLDQAREKLESTLEKNQFQEFETTFIAAVEKATAIDRRKIAPPAKQLTYLKMSRMIILELLKELENLSGGLYKPLEVESLHDMRIAAKRLRYALELFQTCWGRAFGSYAKRAARIQSALGDVHDCDVWIESLGNQIGDVRKQKQEEQLTALVWLMNHFIKLRTKYLRQSFSRWRDWETAEISAKIRAGLAALPKKP